MGTPILPSKDTRNNYVWKNVSHERIIEYLSNITIHSSCFNASPKIVGQYILNQVEDGELINWTVALVSTISGEKRTISGLKVGLSWRTDQNAGDKESDTIYLIRNNLITESDQDLDLSEDQKALALQKTIDNWKPNGRSKDIPTEASPVWIRKCRDKENGLLLIYPFRSGSSDKNRQIPYDEVYIGYAISFPDSDTARPVEYKVDEVYLRNVFDEE